MIAADKIKRRKPLMISANNNLRHAFELLGYTSPVQIKNEQGKITDEYSPQQQVEALFSIFHMAGFLEPNSLLYALKCLSADKPFAKSIRTISDDLNKAISAATVSGDFNPAILLEEFFQQEYFTVTDCIELIVFLQQTAFDRQFGIERDKLTAKPWMEEHWQLFLEHCKVLGITTEQRPNHDHYDVIAIMGAGSVRTEERIQTFWAYKEQLNFDASKVYLLTSSTRELSKGLDSEDVIRATAEFHNVEILDPFYIEKVVNEKTGAKREFVNAASPVTERMMAEYLLFKVTGKDCRQQNIKISDAAQQEDSYRATTSTSASDFADKLSECYQDDAELRIMMLAEQPYTTRMARQVGRAVRGKFSNSQVDGVGIGLPSIEQLSEKDLSAIKGVTARVYSATGSLMAERYNDCKAQLIEPRDPKSFMFSSREKLFQANQENLIKSVCSEIDALKLSGAKPGHGVFSSQGQEQVIKLKQLAEELADNVAIDRLSVIVEGAKLLGERHLAQKAQTLMGLLHLPHEAVDELTSVPTPS